VNKLAKMIVDQGLAINNRVAESAGNGADWLFKRDTLIKSGRTWYELIHDDDLMNVRYYELPGEEEIELVDGSSMPINRQQHDIPLVLVPPLGVTTETFDLMPQRSLVRYMAACGFKTYLIDWGKPGKEHTHLDLKSYAYDMMNTALEKVRRHSGSQQLSLMGWCMGGLLSIIHQGLVKDPDIRNVITIASPIDVQGGAGVISGIAQAVNGPAKLVSNYTKFRINTLDPSRFSFPPWVTTTVFKMTDPVGSVTTYFDLVTRLWDREFVESHTTTSDYLNNMLRYPGGVMQDMTVKIIGDNQMAAGELEVGGEIAELHKIESNFLAFAGKTDNLVPAEIAQCIVEIVSSSDKEFRVVPGGHMGVIIGSKAQKAVWAESAEWLAERSQAVATQKKPRKQKKVATKAKAKPKTKAKAKLMPTKKATVKAAPKKRAKATAAARKKAARK
jgi:poly[(R)-3-hydroxyalkanoate] polymerase subunit PhaC